MSKFLSHLFIPQKSNNYKAYLAQPGFMALLLAIYMLNQSILRSLAVIKPGILGFSSEITAEKVFYLTNLERRKIGLPELRLNSALSQSATLKAQHMFANNYWAHNAPDGTSPWTFFKQAGYQYLIAGENLAKDFYDTETMLGAWMKSPTHRDNILHTKYEEIGIGVVNGRLSGMETTLVVQHFGDPVVSLSDSKNPIQPKIVDQTEVVQTQNAYVEKVWGSQSAPSQTNQPLINPLTLSKLIGGIIFGLMTVVMFIDGLVTVRKGNYRLSGSATGQVGFLAIIFILLMITKQGTIF